MKLVLTAALVLVSSTARADPPPPQPNQPMAPAAPAQPTVPATPAQPMPPAAPAQPMVPAAPAPIRLRIEASNESSRTRLLIPRNLLGSVQQDGLQQGAKTRTALTLPSSAAVLALAVALSLAGFCVVRRPRPLVRGILVVLVLALLAPGAISVAQSVGVGRSTPRAAFHPSFHPDFQLTGPIVVEVADTGDTVRLVLARRTPLHQRSK